MRTARDDAPDDSSDDVARPDPARGHLDRARAELRGGSTERAWEECRAAASLARARGDAELMAEAASIVAEPNVSWRGAAAKQALCLEALGMLGPTAADDTTDRRAWRDLVRTRLDGLSTGWAERIVAGVERVGTDEAERRFVAIQTAYQRAVGARGLADRLELAAAAVTLGRASGDDAILAWGWHWRADALEQLGLRLEFTEAVGALAAVVERLASPAWTWRLAAARACLALLEDRLDDVPRLTDVAREAGQQVGADDAVLFDLTLRSTYAERTGHGLAEVEADVRAMVAEGPLFAQSWRAELLLQLGRTDDAVAIQRSLAGYVDRLPDDVHEWLIARASLGVLSIAAGDAATAERIRALLAPHAHLHLSGPITTPYGGPVALPLARLSVFLGDAVGARRYADEALSRAEAMGAPWFAAAARAVLSAYETSAGTRRGLAPLSPRETQVAELVAQGRTNREVAAALHLSERTVEQHVRRILQRLGMPNRSAVAAWVAARR